MTLVLGLYAEGIAVCGGIATVGILHAAWTPLVERFTRPRPTLLLKGMRGVGRG